MTRVAFAYMRVSTRKQDEEMQRLQIANYTKTRDLMIPEDGWFKDKAVSGFKVPPMERQGFRDMYETLEAMTQEDKERAPRHVVVYEISRLGRNFWEMFDAIKVLEDKWPIISSSPKEAFLQVDDRSMRQLFLTILVWAAERERELLVQRTVDGVARAKEEDRHSGNVPWGYDIHRCALGVCISDPKDQCALHGRLLITRDGQIAYDMLAENPDLKPRELKGRVSDEIETDYDRFALIRNVKKFGIRGILYDAGSRTQAPAAD